MKNDGIVTSEARRAATDPPPGAEERAATLWTNWSTLSLANGPNALTFKRYSMILSLCINLHKLTRLEFS